MHFSEEFALVIYKYYFLQRLEWELEAKRAELAKNSRESNSNNRRTKRTATAPESQAHKSAKSARQLDDLNQWTVLLGHDTIIPANLRAKIRENDKIIDTTPIIMGSNMNFHFNPLVFKFLNSDCISYL